MRKKIIPKAEEIVLEQGRLDENGDLIKPAPPPVYHTYEDFPYEDLLTYAGIDNIVTSELLSSLWPKITEVRQIKNKDGKVEQAPAILDSVIKYEMPAFEFLLKLEIEGVKYNCEHNRKISARMVREIGELEERIFTKLGRQINLDSSLEVTNLLYNELGHKAPTKTKSGEDSTDGTALLLLAGLDPLAQKYETADPSLQYLADMAKRKDINSVHNTFIKDYISDFVKPDGRIHPAYNMTGTSGFRISGDSPNLLQLPRPKHGYNVRECYRVEDGNVFITLDFKSAEVKVLANLCRDKNMLKAIIDDLDFHSFSAASMYGIPYEEFVGVIADRSHPKHKEYKLKRQVSKVLTFSLIYGSSVGGIALQLNISKPEAEQLMNMYFSTFPGVKKFLDESAALAIANKFVVTPFGQRKQEYGAYPAFKSTAAYNAALRNSSNVRVQSPTSTLGLVTFTEMDKALRKTGSHAICTVYDSVEIEAPLGKAAEAVEIGYYYMNEWILSNFSWVVVPIGADCEIGPNWGQLVEAHRGVTNEEIQRLMSEFPAL